MNPTMMSANQKNVLDVPFMYVYNASDLTDGSSYNNISVALQSDSEFRLRRIAGVNTVASKFRYYDQIKAARASELFRPSSDFVVAPELVYSPDSQIILDLGTVARSFRPYTTPGSIPNYKSQIVFQGVKRYYGASPNQSNYSFYNRPFSITWDIPVDYTGRQAPDYQTLSPFKQFSIAINDFDFELLGITATMVLANASGASAIPNGHFAWTLLSQSETAYSSGPVLDVFQIMNTPNYNSAFPCPTVLYTAGSVLRLNLFSLLVEAEVPATLTLTLHGYRRYPAYGN